MKEEDIKKELSGFAKRSLGQKFRYLDKQFLKQKIDYLEWIFKRNKILNNLENKIKLVKPHLFEEEGFLKKVVGE